MSQPLFNRRDSTSSIGDNSSRKVLVKEYRLGEKPTAIYKVSLRNQRPTTTQRNSFFSNNEQTENLVNSNLSERLKRNGSELIKYSDNSFGNNLKIGRFQDRNTDLHHSLVQFDIPSSNQTKVRKAKNQEDYFVRKLNKVTSHIQLIYTRL